MAAKAWAEPMGNSGAGRPAEMSHPVARGPALYPMSTHRWMETIPPPTSDGAITLGKTTPSLQLKWFGRHRAVSLPVRASSLKGALGPAPHHPLLQPPISLLLPQT